MAQNTLGSLIINLEMNSKHLVDGFNRAESVVNKSAKNIKTAIASIAAGVGVNELASQFIKTADAMNLLDARLKLVTSSASEFTMQQKAMTQIAKETFSNVQDITKLYIKLDPALKQLGASTQGVNKVTENFAKGLKLGGASAEEASSAILQFSQAMGSGVLRGEEFNAIAEASPKLLKYIADGIGVPQTALRDLAKDGKLTADIVASALLKMSDAIDKDFKNLPLTVSAATTNLITDAQNMTHAFDQITGASASIAESIKFLSEEIESNTTIMPIATQFFYDAKTALDVLQSVLLETADAFAEIASPITEMDTSLISLQNSATGVVSFLATINATLSNSSIMFENATLQAQNWYAFLTRAGNADEVIDWNEAIIKSNRERIKSLEEIGNAGLDAGNKAREAFQLSDAIKNGKELNKIYEDFDAALDEVLESEDFNAQQEIDNIAKTSKALGKKHETTKEQIKEESKLKKEVQDAENDLAKEGFKIKQEFQAKNHKDAQKSIDIINEKTKQQQSDNEAFLKIIESETDKINNAYLDIYETQKLIASPEQLEAFYKKWQGAIDDIKPPKDDFEEWGKTLNSSISNALVDALKDGDVMGAVKSLGASISASMIQSSVSNIASGKGDLLSMGGVYGIAAGIGISAIASLFGGKKGISAEEQATKSFDSFIKSLDKASEAAVKFGNTGTATNSELSSLQIELQRQEIILKATNDAYGIIAKVDGEGGVTLNDQINASKTLSNNQDLAVTEKLIEKYSGEINKIVIGSLADSIDYGNTPMSKINEMVSGSKLGLTSETFIDEYQKLETQLNEIAIRKKASTLSEEDYAKTEDYAIATGILVNDIYKEGKNYKEAIAIRLKADEELNANLATWNQRNETASETTNRLITTSGIKNTLDVKSLDTMNASIKLMELEAIATNGMDAAELSALQSAEALRDGLFPLKAALDEVLYGITDSEKGFLKFKDSLTGGQNFLDIAVMNVMGIDKLISDIPNTVDGITALYKEFEKTGTGIDEFEQAILDAATTSYKATEALNNATTAQEDYINILRDDVTALNKDVDILNSTLSSTAASISTLESAFDKIKNTADTLRSSTKAAEDNIKDFYKSMAETKALSAGTNYEAYIKSLDETIAASAALTNAENFTLSRDMKFAQLVAANQFEELGIVTMTQTDYLKEIAQNTEDQISAILLVVTALGEKIDENLKPKTTSSNQSVIEAYQQVLNRMPDQQGLNYWSAKLDLGTTSIDNLANAIAQSAIAYTGGAASGVDIAASQTAANNYLATAPTPTSSVQAIYDKYDLNQYQTDSSGIDYWVAQLSSGALTTSTIDAAIKASAEAVLGTSLPSFAVGTPNVPYDMMANLHQGEIVTPKNYSEGIRSGDIMMGDTSGIIKQMEKQNALLNAIITKQDRQIAILLETKEISNGSLEELQTLAEAV